MTGKRYTNFFEENLTAPIIASYILADLPVTYVPTIISALETRKYPTFWATKEDWYLALDAITLVQERLLMDATDRIVSEIRALRNGTQTELSERDPSVDPYTLGLTSLRDVSGAVDTSRLDLGDKLTTANELLVEVRDAILAGGTSGEDQLAALQQIIFLLGAA